MKAPRLDVRRLPGGTGRGPRTRPHQTGRDAERLISATASDLTTPAAAAPIGADGTVCERPNGPQRAFPPLGKPLGKPLRIDETRRRFAPYAADREP
ncbi:DUF2083 domain-containing protein [Roseospira marina]|uniref:DUF2083 domain-containing protein n=1 Tax=Roseospira marina TaxID=140057 RepID=A0A5M6I9V9_9PROT|nr:short-chain fatty acyl-CoA regulator family protein [Roseospira marina]KAA5604519.1 DUF2083 domain-containing protein [Roseospira marina]